MHHFNGNHDVNYLSDFLILIPLWEDMSAEEKLFKTVKDFLSVHEQIKQQEELVFEDLVKKSFPKKRKMMNPFIDYDIFYHLLPDELETMMKVANYIHLISIVNSNLEFPVQPSKSLWLEITAQRIKRSFNTGSKSGRSTSSPFAKRCVMMYEVMVDGLNINDRIVYHFGAAAVWNDLNAFEEMDNVTSAVRTEGAPDDVVILDNLAVEVEKVDTSAKSLIIVLLHGILNRLIVLREGRNLLNKDTVLTWIKKALFNILKRIKKSKRSRKNFPGTISELLKSKGKGAPSKQPGASEAAATVTDNIQTVEENTAVEDVVDNEVFFDCIDDDDAGSEKSSFVIIESPTGENPVTSASPASPVVSPGKSPKKSRPKSIFLMKEVQKGLESALHNADKTAREIEKRVNKFTGAEAK